ncbi:GntR family transcriptional regulator [Paenibacillus septentrionalis]|uniref:GntR family transcriptional regulator n=1 Tax=Paenibacillus septentrionalis TaxID=429342 RepID=A0ABW1V264_9BACL
MTVQGVSKAQIAYQFIYEQIVDGSYRSGQRLIVDHIASQTGLSQSPIREAIRKLESEGFLINKPYCGVIVASMELSESINRMHVLGILDSSAAGLSAPNLSYEDIRELENINKEMNACIELQRYQNAGKLDRQFHNVLNSRCQNDFLLQSIQDQTAILETIRELNIMFYPVRLLESVNEHRQIIMNIKEEAFDSIEPLVRVHMMNSITAYSIAMDQ